LLSEGGEIELIFIFQLLSKVLAFFFIFDFTSCQ